ncbi:UPF0125 protein [Arenicella chitinivorans]|uniref:UPF0125 protein GCM10008090_08840 n=1 Tax=Arenicella chitinivorans TaxID=1329800 RepID=A0A918RK15_9GAMM|nr:RnfH family protein [Arenicella chitinivorans]GHA01864.1 UPF0125 protein [Arenicella chitinivorans]
MHKIDVSIVYATREQQWLFETTVPRGTSALELYEMSGFADQIPGLKNTNCEELDLGVFADKVENDYLLESGDRVEIYRPLLADPKEVRRQLALVGKTMGKS